VYPKLSVKHLVEVYSLLLLINTASGHFFHFDVIWCIKFNSYRCGVINKKTKYKVTNADIDKKKNKMNCELMLTYDTPADTNVHFLCMFNVYKNQLSRQTGSRNLTGPKTLPTIWHTYMKLVTKYQISAINTCSC
jgi:hypothetical protein